MTLTLVALALTLIPLVGAAPALAYTENGSGWDCTTMGNQVCGPGTGVVAGQYANGVMVPWPHEDVAAVVQGHLPRGIAQLDSINR